jgi:hypothetical protein
MERAVALELAQPGAQPPNAAGQIRDQRVPLLGWDLSQHLLFEGVDGPVTGRQGAPPPAGQCGSQDLSVGAVWLALDQPIAFESADHLAHRLRCDVGTARELGVREAIASRDDRQRRISRERQVVGADDLVDLTSQGAVESSHDIADAGLPRPRHVGSVSACTVRQPDTSQLVEKGEEP